MNRALSFPGAALGYALLKAVKSHLRATLVQAVKSRTVGRNLEGGSWTADLGNLRVLRSFAVQRGVGAGPGHYIGRFQPGDRRRLQVAGLFERGHSRSS